MTFVFLQIRTNFYNFMFNLRTIFSFKNLNDEINFLFNEYKRLIVFYHENNVFNNYKTIEFIDKQKQNRKKSNATFNKHSLNFRNEFLSKTMKKIYNCRKIQFNYMKRLEIYLKKIIDDCNDLFTIFQFVFFYFISQNFEFNVDVYIVFCKIYQLARYSRFSRILRKIRKMNHLTNVEIFDKLEKIFELNDLFHVQRTLFLEQIKS